MPSARQNSCMRESNIRRPGEGRVGLQTGYARIWEGSQLQFLTNPIMIGARGADHTVSLLCKHAGKWVHAVPFFYTTAAKWRDRVNWLVTIGSSMFGSSHSGFFAQNRRPECRPCSRSTRRLGTHGTFGGIRIIGHSFVRFATSMPATTLSSRKNTGSGQPTPIGPLVSGGTPGCIATCVPPCSN